MDKSTSEKRPERTPLPYIDCILGKKKARGRDTLIHTNTHTHKRKNGTNNRKKMGGK